MKKNELARLIEQISDRAGKEKFHIIALNAKNWEDPNYKKEECIQMFVESASNVADTKLIKGRISLKSMYLVSRGSELPCYSKPDAIAEYSRHWPYDFCYFYRV